MVRASGPIRPHDQKGLAMSDKSPRQTMSKKSGKSLKEKRAAKNAKSEAKLSAAQTLFDRKAH
jgi:hypothetical protein